LIDQKAAGQSRRFLFRGALGKKALILLSLNEGCICLRQNWYTEAFPAKVRSGFASDNA